MSETIITQGMVETWVGRKLTGQEVLKLLRAVQHSSIPEAFETIISSWDE